MKNLKMYCLAFIALSLFFACSDDDNVPAPEFEGSGNVSVELKRDTADFYEISLPVTSEKGLAKISLLDASGNKLNEVTSFADVHKHVYTYKVDLTPYTVNTVLMLTLHIEDLAGQQVSQKITLTVKKFSELDIRFATEGTIISQFEDCNMKLTVVRGMIPLKEVQVYVGATLSNTYDLSLDPEQTKYELNVLVNGLVMGDNTVKVVVLDAKDQKFEKEVTASRIAAKTWKNVENWYWKMDGVTKVTVRINRGYLDGSDDDLPEDGVLYRIGFEKNEDSSGEYLTLRYDAQGRVNVLEQSKWIVEGGYMPLEESKTLYTYVYASNGELQKVTRQVDAAAATDYLTDFVYESGSIKSYKIEGASYVPRYVEKDGEMIRVDKLEKAGQSYGLNKKMVNPLYVDALPPVVPGTTKNFDWSQYLYNKYLFTSVEENGAARVNYDVTEIERVEEEFMGTIYVTISQYINWTEGGTPCYILMRYRNN